MRRAWAATAALVSSAAALSTTVNTVPRGALGPPAHFDNLDVNTQFLSASRECSVDGTPIAFEVVRLSSRPACFHVGGMLSEAECDAIVAAADAKGMERATTAGGSARQNCGVAWLPVESDCTAAAVSAAVETLFLRPELFELGDGGRFESMQVLRYAEGGEFKLHYDANGANRRVLTVLLYLNGVGATWFPLALQNARDAADVAGANPPGQVALAAARRLTPGRDGVTVAPRKGDAVAFYNYMDDGSGELDRLTAHAGLPAPAEKSVAALWYCQDSKRR